MIRSFGTSTELIRLYASIITSFQRPRRAIIDRMQSGKTPPYSPSSEDCTFEDSSMRRISPSSTSQLGDSKAYQTTRFGASATVSNTPVITHETNSSRRYRRFRPRTKESKLSFSGRYRIRMRSKGISATDHTWKLDRRDASH